jgi:hypothetical protein
MRPSASVKLRPNTLSALRAFLAAPAQRIEPMRS